MNTSRKILSFLHIIAAVASIFLMFPVLLVYENTAYGAYYPAIILAHFGIVILVTLIGFVVERYLHFKHFLTVILGVVLITGGIIFTADYRLIAFYLCAAVGYCFGAYTGAHDYDSMLTPAHMYLSLGVHIAGMVMGIFLWLHLPIEYSFALYVPDVLLYLLMYFLVRNQSNVDFLMGRASVKVDRVPFSMRKYNLILTFALVIPPLVLYFLQGAVRFVLFLLGKGISGIVWLIGQIFGLLFSGEMYPEIVNSGEDFFYEHEEIEATTGGKRPFNYELASIIVMTMITAVVLYLAVYLLVKYKPFKNFKDKIRSLLEFLMKKLDSATVYVQPQNKTSAFVDRFTEIEGKKGRKLSDDPFKQWKLDYKSYRKITDTKERYKEGFLLLREYFRLQRIPLADGDTADEIHTKMASTERAFDGAINMGYDLIYYADQEASEEGLAKLDACLAEILKEEEARKKEKYD